MQYVPKRSHCVACCPAPWHGHLELVAALAIIRVAHGGVETRLPITHAPTPWLPGRKATAVAFVCGTKCESGHVYCVRS